MGIFQSKFLAHQREDGLIEHLILQMECQRRTLALRQIVDIMLLAYIQGILEEFALWSAGCLYLLQHTHIDFLPETGHRGHTRRMSLLHRLLHLQGIGVHDQRGTLRQTEDLPTFLKDMGKRQEIEHTVVLSHRHTFIIGLHRSVVLATGEDDTLRVARRTTGIEDVGDIVHRSRSRQGIHFRLSRQILTQLQEVVEIHGIGILFGDAHTLVEDDDALHRLTGGEYPAGLVVLFLLADEQEAHLRVIHHELDLLLRAGGIERDGDGTDAPCTEVTEQVLDGVL